MKKRYIKHLGIVLIILDIMSAIMVFITGADWAIITFVICLILSFITLITIDFG